MNINGNIANHGQAIWRYVLKRSAERSKHEFKGILNLLCLRLPVTCIDDHLVFVVTFPPRFEYRP